MSSFIQNLSWRGACKFFKAEEDLDASTYEKINKSIQMAPTSFGLQSFYVKVIRDKSIQAQLRKAGWNQNQFETASAIYVFIARLDVKDRITEFVKLIKETEPVRAKTIEGYEKMMRGSLENKSKDEVFAWAAKQTYIALGFAMAACTEMKVDSCPMEGFLPEEFSKILNLKDHHRPVVCLAVGKADQAQTPYLPKLRFPTSDVIR